jgi:hypothetical protein
MITSEDLRLYRERGIVLPQGVMFAADARMAADAQPQLAATVANAGIPWAMTNVIDPQTIKVLVAPMKASAIVGGETKKGDWTTLSTQFAVGEYTGFTTSYGDYNNNGNVGANFNWTPRQSYHFQTVTQWGEREADLYGAAQINYAAELNNASALIMAKFLNKSYFYGVASLQNYGLLNDPSLTSPLTPATKTAGGTTWTNATPSEVNADVQALYAKLQNQLGGNLELDAHMVLAMPPVSEVSLLNTNSFNVSVRDMLQKNFPNLRVETAPEYVTQGGNLVQLIVEEIDGVKTALTAFTEKMRAHAVIADLSSWKQKKSGGTWGTIIRRPLAIAQMLGV